MSFLKKELELYKDISEFCQPDVEKTKLNLFT